MNTRLITIVLMGVVVLSACATPAGRKAIPQQSLPSE